MTPSRSWAALLAATLTTAALTVAAPSAGAVPVAPPTTTVVWTEGVSPGVTAVRSVDASGARTTVGTGPFVDPVAVDDDGTVYVTDSYDVFAFAPGASSPARIVAGMQSIIDLAVDSRGNVYVSEFFVGVFRIDAVTGVVSPVLENDASSMYFSIAIDADDDLIATRDVFSPRTTEVVERPADGGPVRTLLSRPGVVTGLAVAPGGTLVLASEGSVGGQTELRHVARDGTPLGTSTATGSRFLLDAGPDGSVYLARPAGSVAEHAMGAGTTRTLVSTTGPVYAVATAPAWVRQPPLRPRRDPDPTPDPTPPPTPRPVAAVTKVQPRLGAGRLAVRAEHLVPGEGYEIRLRGLVRHRGVVGPDGVVERRVRVSARLSGTRRLKVVGAVSGVVAMVFEAGRD